MSDQGAARARNKRSGGLKPSDTKDAREGAFPASVQDANKRPSKPPDILARIGAALDKLRAQRLEVRALYLDEADRDELRRETSRYWRRRLQLDADFHPPTVETEDGETVLIVSADLVPLALREGGRSIIYTRQGVGFAVPKRLSRKVL